MFQSSTWITMDDFLRLSFCWKIYIWGRFLIIAISFHGDGHIHGWSLYRNFRQQNSWRISTHSQKKNERFSRRLIWPSSFWLYNWGWFCRSTVLLLKFRRVCSGWAERVFRDSKRQFNAIPASKLVRLDRGIQIHAAYAYIIPSTKH